MDKVVLDFITWAELSGWMIGAVVYGEKPEFEEVTKVAEDFPHFLQLITSGSIAAG